MKYFHSSIIKRKQLKSNVPYSHDISQGILAGSSKTWVIKKHGDSGKSRDDSDEDKDTILLANAESELLAQEFFRLLIPHQPETRLLLRLTEDGRTIPYICSAMVDNYRPLPRNESHFFTDGTYSGLGLISVGAIFVEEMDLKNGNIGLDNFNRLIKIDGDRCFGSEIYPNTDFKFTSETIAALPYPHDVPAYNWLDYITQSEKHPTSFIVSPDLSSNPAFRKEVNQALLQICIMPDDFLERFVYAYKTINPEKYLDLIKKNRDQLRLNALQDPDFGYYLQTPEAKKDAEALISHMQTFVADGDTLIVNDSEHADVHARVHDNFENLKLMLEVDILMRLARSTDILTAEFEFLQQNQSSWPSSFVKEKLLKMKEKLEERLIPQIVTDDRQITVDKTLIDENINLVKRIYLYGINNKDEALCDFCYKQTEELNHIVDNKDELIEMRDRLEATLKSAEVRQRYKYILLSNQKLIDSIRSYDVLDPVLNTFCDKHAQELQALSDNPDEKKLLSMKETLNNERITQINENNRNISGCKVILDKIKESQINDNDTTLMAFYQNQKERLKNFSRNPDKNALLTMQKELKDVLESVNSAEVLMVKEAVQKLRDGCFSKKTKQAKATKIEEALINTPLEQRKNVISSTKVNVVQQELARHRTNEKIYVDKKTGELSITWSANSFRRLKRKIDELKKQSSPEKNAAEEKQTDIPGLGGNK